MVTNDTIAELSRLRDELLENARHLEKTIQLLKGSQGLNGVNGVHKPPTVPAATQGSERTGTTIKKGAIPGFNTMGIDERIIAIIKHEGRFLYRTEIEAIAKDLGKPFKNIIASSLSAIKKKEEEGITMYKIEHNLTVWGYQTWLNEDLSIKPEHMYLPKKEDVMA